MGVDADAGAVTGLLNVVSLNPGPAGASVRVCGGSRWECLLRTRLDCHRVGGCGGAE
jgi:hypothetical protein